VVEILYRDLSYAIVGAAMEVHRQLGAGFLASVYQAALAHELESQGIAFEQYAHLPVCYKGISVGDFIADMVVGQQIILELKAVEALHPKHAAQARNYLAATGLRLAILLNFGAESLQRQRVIR
jgi:GxxExxY protein